MIRVTPNITALSSLPALSILTGVRGSGKSFLAKKIGEHFKYNIVFVDKGVAGVRQAIEMSYKVAQPTLYVIDDADMLSTIAKNSLLKITEEPPNLSKFMLTCTNLNYILPTLISRGVTFTIDSISHTELEEYAKALYECSEQEIEVIKHCCRTRGDVVELFKTDPVEFYNFCQKFVDIIHEVPGVNAMKIVNNFNQSEDKEGFNARLFLACISGLYGGILVEQAMEGSKHNVEIYSSVIQLIMHVQHKLSSKSANIKLILDYFILEIREILLGVE